MTSSEEQPLQAGTITKLAVQKHDTDRVSVFIEGAFAFGVHQDLVVKHRLRTGQVLSPDEQRALMEEDRVAKANAKALDYLAHKPRTELEVRRKLRQREFEEPVIDRVIERLCERGYLDDAAYAEEYVRRRFSHKGYGPVRLQMELKQRGIDRHLAETAVEALFEDKDERAAARAKAEKRWPRIAREKDLRKRRNKLYRYLKRRGYTYDTIQRVVDEMERRGEGMDGE